MKTENGKAETVRADGSKAAEPKATAKAATPLERAVVRMDISLGELMADAENREIDEGDEDFAMLVDSVRVMGILVALQVQKRVDGKFQICDGERRWRAATRAGLATVPCDVWPAETHARDLVLAGVVINEQRQAHSCLAVARRLRAVKNQFGESHEHVAARTGLPLARVKAYLNLFHSSDRLLAFFEDSNLPLRTAIELVRFEKLAGEVAARRLLEAHASEPLTVRAIELQRKRHEARRREGDENPSAKAKAAGGNTLATRVEAAFRRDPAAARAELEAIAAKLGFRLVPTSST